MIILEGMHHISLGSADLEKTLKFYCELLDFDLVEKSENYAVIHLDPFSIRFNYIEDYQCSIKNPGKTSIAFVLDVDDFTDAIQELEKEDIKIIKGPVVVGDGESMIVSDPDGHLIEMFYKE